MHSPPLRVAFLTLGVAVLLLSGRAAWADDWVVIEENADAEQGYILERRPVEGSDFPEFRIRGTVDAPPEKVIRALQIMLTDRRYAPDGQTAEILESGTDRWVIHTHVDLPMLFSDRDVVTTATLSRDEARSQYGLRWVEASDAGPEPAEGVVRMPSSKGSWSLTPTEAGDTLAVCETHSDVGGSLPAWLVSSRSVGFVVDRLTTLRRIAAGL